MAESQFVAEIKDKGMEYTKVLKVAEDMFRSYVADGYHLVGHNFVKFDIPFFEAASAAQGASYKFDTELLVDTGILIKAAQIPSKILDRETPRQFYRRVGERPARIKYAIDRFCLPYWYMEDRFSIDADKAHDGGYDCFITDLVMKEMIEEAKGNVYTHNAKEAVSG
jgi:DNA polymerase III epsilon subunit-like protein